MQENKDKDIKINAGMKLMDEQKNLWILLIHLFTALKTPAAFHEQIRSLERARVRLMPSHCSS